MIMTSDGENLTGLWFEKQKYRATEVKDEVRDDDIPVFENTRLWLDIYFAGNCPDFVPPIKFNAFSTSNPSIIGMFSSCALYIFITLS